MSAEVDPRWSALQLETRIAPGKVKLTFTGMPADGEMVMDVDDCMEMGKNLIEAATMARRAAEHPEEFLVEYAKQLIIEDLEKKKGEPDQ